MTRTFAKEMNDEGAPLSEADIQRLKRNFETVGYQYREFSADSFVVFHETYEYQTLVTPNPFFLELGTIVYALPRGWRSRRIGRLRKFLCEANQLASLAKFTCDESDRESKSWMVAASAKLVTGQIGMDYDSIAIERLMMLWTQDIAALIASQNDTPFILEGMRKGVVVASNGEQAEDTNPPPLRS